MSRPPPFRQRPSFYLSLTPLSGSPNQHNTSGSTSRSETPMRTPSGTPLATTSYSPFASADLKVTKGNSFALSESYGQDLAFRPRSRDRRVRMYNWGSVKRILTNKRTWLTLMVFALVLWWFNGGTHELDVVKLSATGFGKEVLQGRRMQDYQFYPASNPKIHYTGRWTSTPNRLRKDGTFPGVYFDITVTNTTSLFLALHNHVQVSLKNNQSEIPTATARDVGHVSFRPITANDRPAPPISLLARVDDDEYILLPNASLLVPVCADNIEKRREHHIRIVAPMVDDGGRGVIELEGLWVSKGGKLKKVPGSMFSEAYADEDLLMAENDIVGERHRTGLTKVEKAGTVRAKSQVTIEDDEDTLQRNQDRKKILEVVTDSPGSFTSKQKGRGRRTGGAAGLLSGVMGWEYLLGEMFGVDHVGIGVDGMCLTQDCIGGIGEPAGLGDVFFRSGPYDTEYFDHPWPFIGYVPDVIILNVGGSDDTSFNNHRAEYNKTYWDLTERFEAAYVSTVKGIRRLAYPKHPAIVQSERSGTPGIVPPNTPAAVPIFVMRPLRGQLEQATQNVVAKLRADGDKAVFWLDTSGWLDPFSAEDEPGDGDFFLDETVKPSVWRLTEQGNQRVAIFLHMHVCRYLAGRGEKCAFLPQEVYQGKVFKPEEANFDSFIESEKERKLKKIFWATHGTVIGVETNVSSMVTTTVASTITSASL